MFRKVFNNNVIHYLYKSSIHTVLSKFKLFTENSPPSSTNSILTLEFKFYINIFV